jgi:guanine nucleotide-binding protein alpha-1 subunit
LFVCANLRFVWPHIADVLRARLKTTGVIEHTFTLRGGPSATNMDWKIYDVGGERSQRQAWAPYFDDVNAIIFLGAYSSAYNPVHADGVLIHA